MANFKNGIIVRRFKGKLKNIGISRGESLCYENEET